MPAGPGQPDAGDPLRLVVPLRQRLDELLNASMSPAQKAALATSMMPQLADVDDELLALLQHATLPIPAPLRTLGAAVEQLHGTCGRLVPKQEQQEHLFQQMLITLLCGLRPKPGFWSMAWHLAQQQPRTSDQAGLFGAMLALTAAQPESLAPPELIFLSKLIREHGALVKLQRQPPEQGAEWYWLDYSQDLAPTAMRRRKPAHGQDIIYFHCGDLGKYFSALLEQLEAGIPASHLGLSAEENQSVCISTLRRALSHWVMPPVRALPRRKGGSRVQVCIRLGDLWNALSNLAVSADSYSDWLVINENPNGCALMHLTGPVNGVIAGSMLGLRAGPAEPWSVWLVRWVRAEAPENVELGLELMAPHAQAVRIAHANGAAEPIAALLLAPLPRPGQGEALLIPQGQYSRGNFTLMTESGQRVKLATCQAGPLRHRTSSVEIFEFERRALP